MMSRSNEWHTDRLIIRRCRPDDLDGLVEMQGDPVATQFIGGPWTLEKTREVLAKVIAHYEQTDLDWMTVTRNEDGAFIGVCWLGPWGDRWRPVLGNTDTQLGYRYARKHWGHGYATEAGLAMLRRGF